jgi:hypothetical protein
MDEVFIRRLVDSTYTYVCKDVRFEIQFPWPGIQELKYFD